MRCFLIAALSLCSAASWANELQIDGSWLQQQAIRSISQQGLAWDITGDQQQLVFANVPRWVSVPKVGDWLELKTRFNPAGVIQRFAWSKSESESAYLLAGHSSRINDGAFADWRWEAGRNPKRLALVKQAQRITIKPNQVKYVAGWCVHVSDLRPAKPSVAGIANETETRFDWWAQQVQQSKCPQ